MENPTAVIEGGDGPFLKKIKSTSSKRYSPIPRSKSESYLNPVFHEPEDVRALQEWLCRSVQQEQDNVTNPSPVRGRSKYTTQQVLVLMSLCLVEFTSYCSMSILAPFFPIKTEERSVSISVTGYIFSIYALVMFIVAPCMGVFVSHTGPKFIFITGVFVTGSCNILFGVLNFITNKDIFLVFCFVVRIMEAIGAAAFSTAAYTFVAEVFPENMSAVWGFTETFVGLGMSIGPGIGGILYELGGYGLPFYTLGGVMLLTLPLYAYLLPSTKLDKTKNSDSTASMWKLLKIKPVVITSLAIVVASNTWGFLDPLLEPHLRPFGLSAKQLGWIFLMFSTVYGLSSPVWGIIADRLTHPWILMATGLVFASIGLILLGPAPFTGLLNSMWINLTALVILGLSISMALLPTFEAMVDFSHAAGYRDDVSTYGLIAGLWSSMYSLGEVTGPGFGSKLAEIFGFPSAAMYMAFLSLIMAIAVMVFFLVFYDKPADITSPELLNNATTNDDTSDDELMPILSLKSTNSYQYGTAELGLLCSAEANANQHNELKQDRHVTLSLE